MTALGLTIAILWASPWGLPGREACGQSPLASPVGHDESFVLMAEDGGSTVLSYSCTGQPAGEPCASDGNPCTDDVCNGAGNCVHTNDNTNVCTDGNCCTDDACVAGACVGTIDNSNFCSDNNPCTDDACLAGVCVGTNDNTNPCSDGNRCTDDACVSGACVGTNDDTNSCSDGSTCTGPDTCSAGACVAGPAINNGAVCDDGDSCATGTGHCAAGVCANISATGTACFPAGGGQVNMAGATLFVPFFKKPASTNDWTNPDGDFDCYGKCRIGLDDGLFPCPYRGFVADRILDCGGMSPTDQLAPLYTPFCGGTFTGFWLVNYRSVGSSQGFREFVEYQVCGKLPTTAVPSEAGLINRYEYATLGQINAGCTAAGKATSDEQMHDVGQVPSETRALIPTAAPAYVAGDARGDVAGLTVTPGDAPNGADGNVNAVDIDYVCVNFGTWSNKNDAARMDLSCDMTGDRIVNAADVDELVQTILGTRRGDANLDGVVTFADRNIVQASIATPPADPSWANGDFDCDNDVDQDDLAFASSPNLNLYGDVVPLPNGNGVVDLDDILFILDAFAAFHPAADIASCGGDGGVDLDDILAVLDAFAGDYACVVTCS